MPPKEPATLNVTPDPVDSGGSTWTAEGSGFEPGLAVNFVLSEPFCCAFYPVTPDAEGNVTTSRPTGQPGIYRIEAYQRLNGKKLKLMATDTFEVV